MTAPQPTPPKKGQPLIQVRQLKKYFPIRKGLIFEKEIGSVKAVDGITFDIQKGETLGLVERAAAAKRQSDGRSWGFTRSPLDR